MAACSCTCIRTTMPEQGDGYVAAPDGNSPTSSFSGGRSGLATNVFLVLFFSISAHASKNALAPAQPKLEKMGLGPAAYAIISATPMLGNIILPTAWGSAYLDHERLVLIAVPLGELLGLVLVTAGFWLLEVQWAALWWAEALIAGGFLTFSAFHGGAYVVQCTVLQRVLPFGETTGFVATIGFTKCIVAACNFFVPPILREHGVLGVQLALLAPGLMSVVAGCWLACRVDRFPVAHSRSITVLDQDMIFPEEQSPDGCLTSVSKKLFEGTGVILLLSFWRAVIMGALHSFATIQNGLVTSYGLSGEEAGELVGSCQTVALSTLVVLSIVADCAGRRVLIVVMSCVVAAGGIVLALGPGVPWWAWQGSLLSVAVASLVIPVVALSLVKRNSLRALGYSFGVLESVFSLAQVVFTIVIGVLRRWDAGEYRAAMVFNASCLCVGAVTSLVLVRKVKDLDSSPASPVKGWWPRGPT